MKNPLPLVVGACLLVSLPACDAVPEDSTSESDLTTTSQALFGFSCGDLLQPCCAGNTCDQGYCFEDAHTCVASGDGDVAYILDVDPSRSEPGLFSNSPPAPYRVAIYSLSGAHDCDADPVPASLWNQVDERVYDGVHVPVPFGMGIWSMHTDAWLTAGRSYLIYAREFVQNQAPAMYNPDHQYSATPPSGSYAACFDAIGFQ